MQTAIASRTRSITVQEPQGQGLRVIPVLGPSHDQPRYRLLDADTLAFVQVTEIDESGSVPELKVENRLDTCVFLMDGQELVGAKQNRILNADVLVPASSTITIPVSCVEQGRWRHVSPQFVSGKAASHRTRAGKACRVYESLKQEGRHDADQAAVWDEVARTLSASSARSDTMALHAAYDRREGEFRDFRASLRLPEQAVGVAVFHGAGFQGLDLFDRHSTLACFWEALIDSYAVDWLGAVVKPGHEQGSPESQALREILERSASGNWERFSSPGEGADWRLDDPALSGSALLWQESVVVHLQLFPKVSEGAERYRPRIHRRYGSGPVGG